MATLTRTSIQQFVAANQISMTAERVDQNPHNKDWRDADHWRVRFKMSKSRMTTYFSMGYGHNGKEPQAHEVLSCLASDSSSVEQSQFEEWARDLGYDEDSRKAESIYKACEKGAAKLRAFLGDDLYHALLYETEGE